MAIRVAHSGNVAPTAVASFGSGLGRRQKEDAAQALSHLEHQQRLDAQKAAQANSLNAAADARRSAERGRPDVLGARTAADEAARLEMMRREAREDRIEGRKDFDFELSSKQRQEYNQLADAYEAAVRSGKFSKSELANMAVDLREKQDAMTDVNSPVRRLKDKSPYPEGQGVGQSWVDKDTGMIMSRDMKGGLGTPKDNPAMTTSADIEKWAKSVPKRYGGIDGTMELPSTPQEISEHVNLMGWLKRRENAKARGAEFNEPMPGTAAADKKPDSADWKGVSSYETLLDTEIPAAMEKFDIQLIAIQEKIQEKDDPSEVAELNHEAEMVKAKMRVMKARALKSVGVTY